MGCFASLSMTMEKRTRCCHAEQSEAESKHLIPRCLCVTSLPLGRVAAVCMMIGLGARLGLAEVETYHIGRGGLSWASQADIQNGTVGVEGALQPLELRSGQNLMELLRAAGQTWLNGSPSDFTKPGQPRTWSNDGPFNQVNGPLQLVDGDPSSSSEGAFRTARNQAGATFFWDLGAPFPIERVRFAPAPGELDWFIKAFELRVSDGEQFNEVRRPVYRLLSRVENNKNPVVELSFNGVQGRFLQLKVLSRNPFNLAEFAVYGEGFVPVSSYVSQLHSFGRPVNFGRLMVRAERLNRSAAGDTAIMRLQLRSGMDDTPIAYFRRDRDTGVREEVSLSEYNNLPRRALYRRDPTTGAVLGEVTRTEYLSLPLAEVGPARDFVQADIREDVDNWSSWTPPLQLDSSATVVMPLDLPSPREFLQFRVFFNGHAASTMRLDSLVVEFSPELVSTAVGEVALASDPNPVGGVLAVPSGVDTSFVCDILTQFDEDDLAGFRGLKLTAFPPPVFERLQMGDPLVEVADVEVEPIAEGFHVFFPPVTRQNNQPMRLTFRSAAAGVSYAAERLLARRWQCAAASDCGRQCQCRSGYGIHSYLRHKRHALGRSPPLDHRAHAQRRWDQRRGRSRRSADAICWRGAAGRRNF